MSEESEAHALDTARCVVFGNCLLHLSTCGFHIEGISIIDKKFRY